MALFGNKKKEEEKNTSCCCCGASETMEVSAACCGEATEDICSSIKVLGAGCKSCHEQYENAKKAVAEMGLDIEVEYITDMEKVMAYGVMSIPAIAVNDKIVSAGRVLKAADVVKLLCGFGF